MADLQTNPSKNLLDRRQAAAYLNVAYTTLNDWTSRGEPNIPFFKIGRKVGHRQGDLDDFIAGLRVTGPARSFDPPSSDSV
jgi:excisionase family DNA binding protein